MAASTTQPHDISQAIVQANEFIYGMNSFNLMNPSMNLCETYPSSLQSVSNIPGHPPFFQQPYIEQPRHSSPAIPSGPQLPQFIRPPAQFIPNQQTQCNLQTNMSTNMTNQSNPPLVAFDMLMTTLNI